MARARLRRGRAPAVAAAAFIVAGCTGPLEGPATDSPVVDENPGPARALPGCGTPSPGPAFIRRLTRFEYDNTVRDLLGDTSDPAGDFPADEKQGGFDNAAQAISASPLLSERHLLAAERLASDYLDANEKTIAARKGCDVSSSAGEDDCALGFLADFAKRAYRRPPEPDDWQDLVDVYKTGKQLAVSAGLPKTGFRSGLELAMTAALQSPWFLFRVELGLPVKSDQAVTRFDSWEMASRLSYLLWGTMPDYVLFAAAAAGQLTTPEQVAAQASRMLGLKRTREMTTSFYEQWLELDRMDGVHKDAGAFPNFNDAVAALMTEEARRFLGDAVWEGAGDLQALFTAAYTFNDATLAQFYGRSFPRGADGKPMTGFQRISFPDGQGLGGILTQGALMTILANVNQTSPVKRGKFVREQLLCQLLPPPPPNAMIVLPALDPNLTTRERFTQHASDQACAGCHTLMDPIGLGFESFDGVGVYRKTDAGKAIDVSGEVRGMEDGKFVGVLELATKLGANDDVRSCFVAKWFQYAYARAPDPQGGDRCSLDLIKSRFAANGYKVKDLLRSLTETDAFLYKRAIAPGGGQ